MSTCPSEPRSASHLRASRRPCRKSLRRYQGNRYFRPAPGEPRSRAACRLRPRRVAASAEVMSPMPLSLGTCCGSDASYPLPGEAASGRGCQTGLGEAREGASQGCGCPPLRGVSGLRAPQPGVGAAGTSHLQPQVAPGAQRPHRWAMGASKHTQRELGGWKSSGVAACVRKGWELPHSVFCVHIPGLALGIVILLDVS